MADNKYRFSATKNLLIGGKTSTPFIIGFGPNLLGATRIGMQYNNCATNLSLSSKNPGVNLPFRLMDPMGTDSHKCGKHLKKKHAAHHIAILCAPGKQVAVNFHQLETPKNCNPLALQNVRSPMFSRYFILAWNLGIPST